MSKFRICSPFDDSDDCSKVIEGACCIKLGRKSSWSLLMNSVIFRYMKAAQKGRRLSMLPHSADDSAPWIGSKRGRKHIFWSELYVPGYSMFEAGGLLSNST